MKRLFALLYVVAVCLTTPLYAATSAAATDDKYPSKKALQKEWSYEGMAFENRGGNDFANMVVATLQMQSSQIEQMAGIKAGDVELTFDGKQVVANYRNEASAKCDYTYNAKTGAITLSGKTDYKSYSIEGVVVQRDDAIVVFFDVNKLLKLAAEINPDLMQNQQLKTLQQMLSSQQGIFVGAKFTR